MLRKHILPAALTVSALAFTLISCESDGDDPVSPGPESVPPMIDSVNPSPGATGISTATTVTVVFSESVQPNTVIILVNGLLRGPIAVVDSIATLTLDQRLLPHGEYVATVPAGVTDLAGNTMDSTYSWQFTTSFAPLGETWTQQPPPTSVRLNGVVRGSQEFLAVAAGGFIFASQDGTSWRTVSYRADADQLWSAFPIGDRFVACGSPGTVVFGDNPSAWTQDTLADSISELYDVWVGFDGIYMVGTGGASETNGILVKYVTPTDWSTVDLGADRTPRSIRKFGDTFVVVGEDGLILTSEDGLLWDDHSLGTDQGDLFKVRWAAQTGLLIAVGASVVTSTDGINWEPRTATSLDSFLRDITWTTLFSGGSTHVLYCTVGDDGRIMTSVDGVTWESQDSGVRTDLYGIGRGLVPSGFVAVGDNGVILTSQ